MLNTKACYFTPEELAAIRQSSKMEARYIKQQTSYVDQLLLSTPLLKTAKTLSALRNNVKLCVHRLAEV